MAEDVAPPLALGIDLGTSAVKVLALTPAGEVLGTGTGPFPTIGESEGAAEQEPADWEAALAHAVVDLGREIGTRLPAWRDGVRAIGLTGQLPTLVCLGDHGVLGRAVTWKDARADAWAATAIDAATRRRLYAQTGMPIDGRYLGPMFHYHWRTRAREVRRIASAKDYFALYLTGVHVTDPSTAAGYGTYDLVKGAFDPALAALWQLPPALQPPVRPAHALAGPLAAPAARTLGLPVGIPVTVGTADSVSSAYAMGGLEPGTVCITMGSSTIILDAASEPCFDEGRRYLLTPHVEPGWYGREMDLLATGTGYRWLSGLFGWQNGTLDQEAARVPAGARGLLFEPYLAGGEQGALWNPALRGVLRGLTLAHGPADIARAFLEGVCYEIRRCVEVLSESWPVERVVVAGHITRQPSSLQLLADVLDRPVRPFPETSPAALGAALGALTQLGGDPARARRALERGWEGELAPAAAAGEYDTLYRRYLEVAAR